MGRLFWAEGIVYTKSYDIMKKHGMFRECGWTVCCACLFGGAGAGRQRHP